MSIRVDVLKEKDLKKKMFIEKEKVKKILYYGIKRCFDLCLSLIGVIFIIPIYIIIKVSYILTGDNEPIVFKQIRTGKDGKNFNLYKFRSMSIKNDIKDKNKEDEYTTVGKIIRKYSIDELLQVINIIKGDMSFIGPRPWIPEYYENMNLKQRRRCDVRPGISGYAQIKGRNSISIFEKIEYDLEYIEKASLGFDLKIIFKTIVALTTKRGVNAGKSTIHKEIEELKESNRREVA